MFYRLAQHIILGLIDVCYCKYTTYNSVILIRTIIHHFLRIRQFWTHSQTAVFSYSLKYLYIISLLSYLADTPAPCFISCSILPSPIHPLPMEASAREDKVAHIERWYLSCVVSARPIPLVPRVVTCWHNKSFTKVMHSSRHAFHAVLVQSRPSRYLQMVYVVVFIEIDGHDPLKLCIATTTDCEKKMKLI